MEKIMKVGIVGCGNISHSHMAAYKKNKCFNQLCRSGFIKKQTKECYYAF